MSQQAYDNFKKLLQSSDYNDAINTAISITEQLLSQDENDYSDSTNSFIDNTLPIILKDLFHIEKHLRKVMNHIANFVKQYITLIVKLNLREKLLKALCECLRNYEKPVFDLTPIQLSDDEKKSIINQLTNPKACIIETENSLTPPLTLINNTIGYCFSKELFKTAIEKIISEDEDKENKITNVQLSLMFRLFYSVEGYLNEEIVFTMLPIFADAAINSLTNLAEDTEGMTQILISFINMIPEESDRILKLLCNLVSTGPVNRRLITIKGIRNIVENNDVSKKNIEEVKSKLLDGTFDFTNPQIFNQVLELLPILSEKVSFTEDDLINILQKVHRHDNQIDKCISEIIPNIKTNLKKFAQFFLESGLYSPIIICSLLSRVNNSNKQLSNSLFSLLLKPPHTDENDYPQDDNSVFISTIDTLFEQGSNMKSLLEDKMKETEDPEDICSLSQIILNAPNMSHIDDFIRKVIRLSEEHENLIPILMSFSSLLEKFDSESTITTLFNKAYEHFNSNDYKYLNQILPVLTEWFTRASSINVDYIIAKLMTIPFMKITTIFVPFVSSVIKRSSEKESSRLKEFLLKIIYDTVPMRFSSWAINNIFQYFHDDKKTIACIVKMLSLHLQGKMIPVDLFDNIFPDNSTNTSNESKPSTSNTSKTRFATRSKTSSRNQKRRRKFSDYSDSDESEDMSSSKESSESESDSESNNKKDRKQAEDKIESKKTLKDILLAQNQSYNERYREEKMKNSIYLIQRAAQYEADFFAVDEKMKVNEQYGNVFKISVTHSKEKFEFEIGLHPYHTCRRLYIEISRIKGVPINKFSLYIAKKSQKDGKLIISSTPISEIVEARIKKIKLNYVENQTNIILEDFIIEPVFLNTLYNDMDSMQALFDHLSSEDGFDEYKDDYLSPIIIETLQLFEPFYCFTPTSPLQKVLLRNYDHPLDFENNMRLFSLALSAYSQPSMNSSDFSKVIKLVINSSFDKFNAVIIMKAIMRIECHDFVFTPELIKKGLIQNNHKSLRHALLSHFNITSSATSSTMMNSFDDIVSLIPLVAEPFYRENSKEFLQCFNKCNLPKDCFIPFFKGLKQYETVNNVDQTFISLLQHIPKNEETIKLTYQRLSVSPTVKNPQNPFVHSKKTRKAAFDFLTTDQVYPILLSHLSMLPEVPTSLKLSDDFTFKGRNGINNLGSTCYINTLMQALNTALNVTNRILSLPSEGLTNYLYQLREFMGQLRYARNPSISIKPLIDTIDPEFDTFRQADTEEFLIQLINRVIDELKESSGPLKEELEITFQTDTYRIGSNEKEGNSITESNFVLSLPTLNLTNLFESFHHYFQDYIIDDVKVESTHEKVTAVRKPRVLKWPNYLIIQLQRWDFNYETQERKKLVHEFGFPIDFSTGSLRNISADSIKDDSIDYELSAILVHEGDIESGHYFAIVNGDNGDWYKCDDNEVKKFDIAEIPEISFGIKTNDTTKDNEITTGYILFYRRRGIQIIEPHLAADFEERINRYNETTWPSTFFFSHQFLDFTKKLTASYPNNEATTEVALTCLFKISIVAESSARQWAEHIQQNFITNANQCQMFFTFIKEKIGGTLGQLVNLSDSSSECLKSVIFTAFKQLPNTTEPLIIVLSSLKYAIHKRSITLACELITLACQDLHVAWKNEEKALLFMVKYMTMEMGRDNILFNKIKNALTESTEMLIKILSNVVLQKGVIEPIAIIFQNDVLDRLLSILKQSESFKILTTFALSLKPSLISSIGETSSEVTDLLMSASPKSFSDSSSSSNNSGSISNSSSEKVSTPLSMNASIVGGILEKLCFSDRKYIRRRMCSTLCSVMDDPDPVVANYINNRVFEPDLICPSIVDESTFLDMIASLLPIGLQNYNLEYFNEFSKVLVKLSIAAPFATSLSFTEIIEAVPLIVQKIDKSKSFGERIDTFGDENEEMESTDDEDDSIGVDMLIRFMIVVKHLVAFDDSLRNQVSSQIIETFLNLEYGREEALQFVALFHKEASGSPLFAACVSEALNRPFSDMSAKIIEMVSNGMSPGNFVVPDATKDLNNIKIATALFQSCEKQRDKLKNYIVYILQHLKPLEALSLQPFAEAVQMIENHYQVKIEDLMQ